MSVESSVFAKIYLKKIIVVFFFLGLAAASVLIFRDYFYKNQEVLTKEHEVLNFTGTVEAKTVMVSFKIPGRIADIFVDEGDEVEKGEELACLESQELYAKLAQAQGAYKAAEAQAREAANSISLTDQQIETAIEQARAKVAQAEVGLKDARQAYDRAKFLHDSGAISDKDFDSATNNYELAQKKLAEAKAGLDQAIAARLKVKVAQSQYEAALGQSEQAKGAVQEALRYLDNTHLTAPVSGYVTQKMFEPGEMANAGTPVFEITDLKHTYVKIFVDEKKIGRVHLNQQAEIRVDSYPGRVFKGKVVWINDAGEFAVRKAVNEQYDHDIRSFEVKIDVPNPNLDLKTGMTARVKILEGSRG